MIDSKIQKKINILLSKIDNLEQRNNFLWDKPGEGYLQFCKDLNEIEDNEEKIIDLKNQISRLYITYSK